MLRPGVLRLMLALAIGAAVAAESKVAAVVASLVGQVDIRLPGASAQSSVSRLDWIVEGSVLEVKPKSSILVILVSGRRYELSEGAKATVTSAALTTITGSWRELPTLPPIPEPSAIANGGPETAAVVRIRGSSEVRDMNPNQVPVLPTGLRLRFSEVPDASGYRVILKDENGDTLWDRQGPSNNADIPDGIIKPGSHYSWQVQVFASGTVTARGTAGFTTVPDPIVARRAGFVEALRDFDEPSRLALLGQIDFRLGLLNQALEELNTAARLQPDDASLRRALDQTRAAFPKETPQ